MTEIIPTPEAAIIPEPSPLPAPTGAASTPQGEIQGNAAALTAPKRARRWRRRILNGAGALLVIGLIFSCGGVFGYTQGPGIATVVASGQQVAQLGTQFQPCFIGFSQDTGSQNLLRTLFGSRNRPTATPGPRPTADPTVFRVLSGTLVELTERTVTVQTAGGGQERYTLFPFLQIVSGTGNRITRQGVLKGDGVDVLAFRANALGPLAALSGNANQTPTAGGGPEATLTPDAYTVLCIIVDVNPKK